MKRKIITSLTDPWLPTLGPGDLQTAEGYAKATAAMQRLKKVESRPDQLFLQGLGLTDKFDLDYAPGIIEPDSLRDLQPVMVQIGNARGNIVEQHRRLLVQNDPKNWSWFYKDEEDFGSIQPSYRELVQATTPVLVRENLLPMTAHAFAEALKEGVITQSFSSGMGEILFPFVVEHEVELDQVLVARSNGGSGVNYSFARAIDSIQFFWGDRFASVPCWQLPALSA